MSLTARVQESGSRLTEADRRILEVLLSHPTEAAFLPAAEVADRAGVHQASATKLAQRLGYAGYPDLRRSLQSDLLNGTTPSERVRRRLAHTGPGAIVDALVDDELAALRDVPRQVDQTDVDRAAALVTEAPARYLFAQGNASVLGDLLARRLARFGLPATVLPASGRDLAEQLVALRAGDAVVAFAFLRPPRHLADLARHCSEVGARLVLVTDTLATELPHVDVALAAARGSGREFQSLTVPMAITNALILTIARAYPGRTGSALSRLEDLLTRFDS